MAGSGFGEKQKNVFASIVCFRFLIHANLTQEITTKGENDAKEEENSKPARCRFQVTHAASLLLLRGRAVKFSLAVGFNRRCKIDNIYYLSTVGFSPEHPPGSLISGVKTHRGKGFAFDSFTPSVKTDGKGECCRMERGCSTLLPQEGRRCRINFGYQIPNSRYQIINLTPYSTTSNQKDGITSNLITNDIFEKTKIEAKTNKNLPYIQ